MDPLYELLVPYFDGDSTTIAEHTLPSHDDPQVVSYLSRLSTLSLVDVTTTEPGSLLHSSQSLLRNLQALSKRSHKAVICSSSRYSHLSTILPGLETQVVNLQHGLPELENAANSFAQKYDRRTENGVLDKRKQIRLLSRNIDRASDVLDLPTLLSSTVATAQTTITTTSSTTAVSYTSALDLHAHIRRLTALYPSSGLIADISRQAEGEMQRLASIMITSLQSPSLKLAGAMRMIGWLKRIAPDLAGDQTLSKNTATTIKTFATADHSDASDGTLGTMFLVCRLRTLNSTLEALEPLRELAEQETIRRKNGVRTKLLQQQVTASALGSQSERYLKRYIEIFREQSFSTISMYRSIFPAGLPTAERQADPASKLGYDTVEKLPSPIAGFSMRLVNKLSGTLREFMPNITDKSARESLLTQVLFCAGSLSRLGSDFSMVIALLAEETASAQGDEPASQESEWIQVMAKHRVQASRLKALARGVSSTKQSGGEIPT